MGQCFRRCQELIRDADKNNFCSIALFVRIVRLIPQWVFIDRLGEGKHVSGVPARSSGDRSEVRIIGGYDNRFMVCCNVRRAGVGATTTFGAILRYRGRQPD
ncbi:hypothetical protein EMIT0P4_50055 [Pseudomonas sp. IT-P4]